ncbi:FAD-dependent thymidylate synthase [candidate division NPL-UPA2 bacterium Unc8]|uniref:Flavin-dependent thymidylate synthase n=1 Tax=candidate division NPL-UPA2 bacterium Unc8 TaxID=1980939 RepID=A0A399FV93_UNCN2|nr:Flavin-dependent thymidylate synthase [Bacillota bacterium]MBT9137757.1 Flavin-dependent thymidylate synthase [Bacillota bacterium]MBT9146305.1 Flavin-dependent thymidylate synthase [Bacillota bacterium]RII00318.1 MAG: FAD-dependent thymidylate synthase [candidate division NPL-UPA2 bacterium Unc8]
MAKVNLNVKLLEVTQNAIAVIYTACRQCYSAKFAGDIFEEGDKNLDKQVEFVKKIVKSGHESPLEHVKFTFAIEGVSRALTHQLVRHRIASFSQQSQRYVKEAEFDYIIPPSIETDKTLKKEFIKIINEIQASYNKILKRFSEKGKTGEAANEDARFMLPQAVETKIVVTMNCRELLHFFKQRCCARAQWEIRDLAEEMLKTCRSYLPAIFVNAGAKCISLDYCPEEEFSCGRMETKEIECNQKKS